MKRSESRTTVVSVSGKDKDSYVYVGRAAGRGRYKASEWGNPFKVGADGDIRAVLLKYLLHVLANRDLLAKLSELRGKALGCWCVDDPRAEPGDPADYCCHAQVLADLAEGPLGDPPAPK